MAGKPLRLLVVDDSDDDALLVEREMKRGGFDLVQKRRVDTLADLDAALREAWDIIVCDYAMPQLDAPRVLAHLRQCGIETPCIIVSGTIDEDMAVEALRGGAQDFVTKQKLVRLIPAVERELREATVRADRARAKLALQRTQESVRSLIESLPDGVLVHRDGVVVYANDAAARLVGAKDAKELHGRRTIEFLSSSATGDTGALREERVHRFDGSIAYVDVATAPILFEEEASVLAVLRDATARRELTAKMIEVDRMISVSILAAGVGHEINNPLAYVVANVEYVKGELDAVMEMVRSGDTSPSTIERLEGAKQVLDEALEGGNRIRNIVSDLRLFSRDDQAPASVDVRPILDSAVRMAAHEVRRSARVVKEYADVPQVEANPSRLGQVFLNLVVNAAQAVRTREDERNEIRLKTYTDELGRVVVDVTDTGPGIAPADMPRIFAPFYTTKPPGEGTGLGLAICRAIVSSVGGDITVSSEVGKGSTFRVKLPAAAR